MTSNQLSYWKLKEEERANTAREQENIRHNVTSEDLERASQLLKSDELDIKRGDVLTRLSTLVAEYGHTPFNALPEEVKEQLYNNLGLEWNAEAQEIRRETASTWETINRGWDRITKGLGYLGRAISALF